MEELSSRLDISLTTVGLLNEALTKEMAKAAQNIDSVVVPGFGTFESRLREERVALHPATGKRLLVPPRVNIVFKQSPVLRAKING